MSSKINVTNNYVWTNEHNNISKQILRRYQISNTPSTGWKDGLEGIHTMIGEARARNERLRSYGGKWSLSDVAACNDSMHDTKPLTYFGTVGKNSIAGPPLFADDPLPLDKRLFYFQAGAQINQINNALEARGVCLATTGASNGQTLAGAVSTGTHGSALSIGSMQDYVRALHIVTSENTHFLLQPAAAPALNGNFSQVLGAVAINDDSLFRSALVSFGSFGVIHGIVVEAVSLFMFESYCMRMDYRKAETLYPFLAAFDHARNDNLRPFLAGFGLPSDEDPYHAEIICEPYSSTQNAFLRVMYKRPYDAAACSAEPGSGDTRVGDDILSLIGSITNNVTGLAPVFVHELFSKAAVVQSGYTQTARNIFGDSIQYKPQMGGASTEFGVPIGRAAESVRLIMTVARQSNFIGLFGIRFVKNSQATLAFTRFSPLTCTIELPGLNSPNTQKFFRSVFAEMDNAGIPFTLHWGQEGDYSPKRLASMYGDALGRWVSDRNRFLPDPLQRYMFTNDFMKRCGLGEPAPLTGGTVIA